MAVACREPPPRRCRPGGSARARAGGPELGGRRSRRPAPAGSDARRIDARGPGARRPPRARSSSVSASTGCSTTAPTARAQIDAQLSGAAGDRRDDRAQRCAVGGEPSPRRRWAACTTTTGALTTRSRPRSRRTGCGGCRSSTTRRPGRSRSSGSDHSPPTLPADFAALRGRVRGALRPGGTFWSAHPELAAEPVDDVRDLERARQPQRSGRLRPTRRATPSCTARARDAILAVDPSARVIVGGLSNPGAFLPAMLAAAPGPARARSTVSGSIRTAPTPGGVISTVRPVRAPRSPSPRDWRRCRCT